jgi:hypothetical protein
MTTTEHGGQRQGAGRPSHFGNLERKTVTLPSPMIAELVKLGEGNLSAGIRRLYENQQESVMSKTVEVEFDPAVLPAWARKHPAVVELSRANLSYRVNVCDA